MPDQPPLDDRERDELIAYLDGELDDKAARAVEAKLNRNPRARAEAEAFRRAWDLLDYLPRPQPSGTFTHKTLDRIAALTVASPPRAGGWRWQPWALGAGWAAAVLLAGAAGYAGVRIVSPKRPAPPPLVRENDPQMVHDARLLENLHRFDHVDDAQFLKDLDDPDLFGDDAGG